MHCPLPFPLWPPSPCLPQDLCTCFFFCTDCLPFTQLFDWLAPSHYPGLSSDIASSEIPSLTTFYNAAHPTGHITPRLSFIDFILWNYLICFFIYLSICYLSVSLHAFLPLSSISHWYWCEEEEREKQHVLSSWELPQRSRRFPDLHGSSVCIYPMCLS